MYFTRYRNTVHVPDSFERDDLPTSSRESDVATNNEYPSKLQSTATKAATDASRVERAQLPTLIEQSNYSGDRAIASSCTRRRQRDRGEVSTIYRSTERRRL